MEVVHLEWSEVMLAANAGVRRRIGALQKRRSGRHGIADGNLWGEDIVGAIGEYAVCKQLDCFWNPAIGTTDPDGDVGAGIQVRSTLRQDGRLILHPSDYPGHAFYLAVLDALPQVKLFGPILADNAKLSDFWWEPPNGRPAYFVPQHFIEKLVKEGRAI